MTTRKGRCQICGEGDHDQSLHVIEESWILEFIKKERPEWVQHDGACPKCVDFYRKKMKWT